MSEALVLFGLACLLYPFGGEALVAPTATLDRASAGDELDEEDAEGVDVAAVGELVRAQVLRVHVSGRPLYHR